MTATPPTDDQQEESTEHCGRFLARPIRKNDPQHQPHINDNGGHWWDKLHGQEPPEWFSDQFGASTVTNAAPQRCETVPTPDVPDDITWEEYTYYCCDGCGWPCIEHEDSEAAQTDNCWCCVHGLDLPDGRAITRDQATDEDVRAAVQEAEEELDEQRH